jgi:hypothetical protein
MKTLFEKLKSEHLDRLKQEEVLYPNSVKAVLDDLKNNRFLTDLKYNTVCMLSVYLKLYSFGPIAIGNLFNEN